MCVFNCRTSYFLLQHNLFSLILLSLTKLSHYIKMQRNPFRPLSHYQWSAATCGAQGHMFAIMHHRSNHKGISITLTQHVKQQKTKAEEHSTKTTVVLFQGKSKTNFVSLSVISERNCFSDIIQVYQSLLSWTVAACSQIQRLWDSSYA